MTVAPRVGAQPSPPPVASAASAHYQTGIRLYDEEDYRSALTEFRRAYEIQPNYTVLFNIGQCYFQLRDYANAAPFLSDYLSEGGTKIAADRRELVERELRDLSSRTGRVRIEGSAPGVTVSIDDVVVTKLVEPVVVNIGRHHLKATADGKSPFTQDFEIAGNEEQKITIVLGAANTATTKPGPVVASEPTRESKAPGPATWVALGVGVVGLGVGTGFGIAALSTKSDLDDACVDKSCPSSSQGSIDDLSRNATISTVGFVVGAVGVAAGLYLWLTHPRGEAAKAALVRFAPTASGIGGSF